MPSDAAAGSSIAAFARPDYARAGAEMGTNPRIRALGETVLRVKEDRRCRWRSLHVRDPEVNVPELVCFDEAMGC